MKTVIDAVNELKGYWPYDLPGMVKQISTGNISSWRSKYDKELNTGNYILICNKMQFEQCVAEMSEGSFVPKASKNMIETVYTEAMASHGISPRIGMECTSHKNDTMVYIFQGLTSSGKAILEHVNTGDVYATSMANIAAIDTRTDKEKAVDDVMSEYGGFANMSKGILSIAYDKWVSKS